VPESETEAEAENRGRPDRAPPGSGTTGPRPSVLSADAPRWPRQRPHRGHYESFFLRAAHPTQPRAVWIRYTLVRPPGGRPAGQLWFTLFDRDFPAPWTVRADAGEPATGDGAWIRLGDSAFGVGSAAGSAGAARWSLRFRDGEPPLRHLPELWMYTGRLPRTKLVSVTPSTVFDGVLSVPGEEVVVDGWPGMVGHNWGEEHAARWIWLHGLGFAGADPGTWLDVAVGRVRIGPATTPWVANGALSLGGRRIRVGGLRHPVSVTESGHGCELRLPAADATVTASVTSPAAALVRWDYPGPRGAASEVVHSSVADLTVRVDRPGAEPLELTAPGRAAYEFGRASG
jgi:hypothetical protein